MAKRRLEAPLAIVISKDNVNPLTLNLLTADKVPDDADAILINTPTVDYTEEEVEKILDIWKPEEKRSFTRTIR